MCALYVKKREKKEKLFGSYQAFQWKITRRWGENLIFGLANGFIEELDLEKAKFLASVGRK